MTFETIMKADMNNRWPDEPRAVGNLASRRCSKTSEANVTEEWSFVQCIFRVEKLVEGVVQQGVTTSK